MEPDAGAQAEGLLTCLGGGEEPVGRSWARPASSHLGEGAADPQSESGVPAWLPDPASPFSHLRFLHLSAEQVGSAPG